MLICNQCAVRVEELDLDVPKLDETRVVAQVLVPVRITKEARYWMCPECGAKYNAVAGTAIRRFKW